MAISTQQVLGLYNELMDRSRKGSLTIENLTALQTFLDRMIAALNLDNAVLSKNEQSAKSTIVHRATSTGKVLDVVADLKKQGIELPPDMIEKLKAVAQLVDSASKASAVENRALKTELGVVKDAAQQQQETQARKPK